MTQVWLAGTAGFVLTLLSPGFDYARHAFYTWRLRRRLARDPYILREEYRDYVLAIGGEPEPIVPYLWVAATVTVACATGAWVAKLEMQELWDAIIALTGAVMAARSLWVLLNSPDEVLAEADPDNTPEAQRAWAWFGFGASFLLVAFVAWNAGWV